MEAIAKLNENNLAEAFAMAKQTVKSKPADLESRSLLAQLFCFTGEWERADQQFEILASQHADTMVGVSLIRQLIRAEQARAQFYSEGRMPEIVGEPDDNLANVLKAMIELRENNFVEAKKLLSVARETGMSMKAKVNGKEVEGGFDLDDLVGAYFEILTTNGKFYFVPMEKVISISFRGYERMQDRIWRSATIQVEGFSTEGEVYFPVNYCCDPKVLQTADDEIKLGAKTDWYAAHADAPVRGMGQKLFVFGDDQYSIMELESFECAPDE